MRVTKAQAQANRARIVDTASVLFREQGYDGVGVAQLMAAAGFTHGGFYRHFRSKVGLMLEAATSAFSQTANRVAGLDIVGFVKYYTSREHRDHRGEGCAMAALCADVARQPEEVKAIFAAGVEGMLSSLLHESNALTDVDQRAMRARTIDVLAHAVGAVVISRACPDDSPLADEILEVCRLAILGSISPSADH
jgi:TetR/AcrR family transcriptional repressor of nem operon